MSLSNLVCTNRSLRSGPISNFVLVCRFFVCTSHTVIICRLARAQTRSTVRSTKNLFAEHVFYKVRVNFRNSTARRIEN